MRIRIVLVGLVVLAAALSVAAQVKNAVVVSQPGGQESPEVQQLKATVESLQKTVQALTDRITLLEQEKKAAVAIVRAAGPAPVPPAQPVPQIQAAAAAPAGVPQGNASPVTPRESFNLEQSAAPRLNDLTLDPKYTGYFPIPNTQVIMQLNAKPHFDMFRDSRYSGDDSRFVTATIPVEGSPNYGGGSQFNMNAKATTFTWDVRAPQMDGSPRFFVQTDFFGSESPKLDIRFKQVYGEYYNVVFGQMTTLFEDPDVWPDTVDWEGPNSMIFARLPAVHYLVKLSPEWNMTIGLERPDSQIANYNGESIKGWNRFPDAGLNFRWEKAQTGHVQFAALFRDIGGRSTTFGDQHAFGWGANLSFVFDVCAKDSLLGQVTYGEGIGRYCNDAFSNMDAAFTTDGDLKPLPYFGGFLGYTHSWSEKWRSTITYGYVHLSDQLTMGADAYHKTDYASLNAVYQFRKKLSLGFEVLYGYKQQQDLKKGDVWRFQFGIAYKIF